MFEMLFSRLFADMCPSSILYSFYDYIIVEMLIEHNRKRQSSIFVSNIPLKLLKGSDIEFVFFLLADGVDDLSAHDCAEGDSASGLAPPADMGLGSKQERLPFCRKEFIILARGEDEGKENEKAQRHDARQFQRGV
jgi:hypothetical protein